MARWWKPLGARLLSELFGEGLGADLAGRGVVYLADEVRSALDRDEQHVTAVRLRPGDSYTVLVRPPATRTERKLTAAQQRLVERDRHLARPSRSQLRAARRLSRAQRRLDRRRAGTRRHAKALVRERRLGERFDRVMRPSRKQVAVRKELDRVTAQLDAARAENMAKLHRKRVRRARASVAERSRVYD